MKNQVKYSFRLFLALIVCSGLGSCGEDEPPVFSAPELSLAGSENILVKVGEVIPVTINFTAEGGAKELVVYRDGGVLEVVPLTPEATSVTYTNQTVPLTALEGEQFQYEFSVVNTQDLESSRVGLTVSARQYDLVTIGGQELYEVFPPEDGVIPSGTELRFVTGRNYLFRGSFFLAAGNTFTVQSGVTLYMDSEAESPITIELGEGSTAAVVGTASSPVVMTSSATLGGTPTAGDWNRFRLNGSVNSQIRYLRTEFANEGLRVSDTDDSNTIEYVQVMNTGEEGFYITNGNVNLKYLYSLNAGTGGFRIGDNYEGNLQFLIAQLSERFDEATELEIRETAKPTISNVTLIGPGVDTQNTHGVRLRSASEGKIYNAIVASFPRRGLRMNDNVVVNGLEGPTVFAYSFIFDVPTDPYRDDTSNGNPFRGFLDENGEFQNPFFNNVTGFEEGNPILTAIPGIGTNAFIPDSEVVSDFNPTALGSFFTAAPYVGAVTSEQNDWTRGWTKNPDGSIR
ncbi:hypothetical protein [Algoriphagus confluentis]|uniref:DUF4842 domain-containing protein n=1 Tax=Algoriphagus confluentis TaxID=1697556 RepID=A0ABQ6PL23_9BACT|nr:hypothetical protein Aconfl_05200 [Algoriphagus confluentis]